MENKKIISEEIVRIHEIMYGKSLLLNENFLGNLTRQAVSNSIRASIEAVMDDFVKKAITKTAAEEAKFVIDDIVKGGSKAAMSVAATANKVYDDVARKAFGKSYSALDKDLQITVKNQVRTALGDSEDDIIKSAKNASDDLSKNNKFLKGTGDDVAKGGDDAAKKGGDAEIIGTGKPPRPKKGGWRGFIQKIKDKWSKMSRRQKLLWLLGAGVALYFIWDFFTEDATEFSDCLKNGVNEADMEKIVADGGENVIRTVTGVKELDAMGGLKFKKDGTVETLSGGKSGTFKDEGSSISITIDGKNYTMACAEQPPIPVPPVPVPDPNPVKYKFCSSLPFTKGCKNSKIRDIQNCIGAKVDGAYGPETEAALISKGYPTEITQEVYDKIIANCGKSAQDNVTTTTTTGLQATNLSFDEL